MFCPNCGTQVNDGSRFCPSCGSPIEAQAESQQPQQPQQPPAPAPAQPQQPPVAEQPQQRIPLGTPAQPTGAPQGASMVQSAGVPGMPASTTETWNPIQKPDQAVLAHAKSRSIPMKWYTFVIWVDLFVGALSSAWTGLQFLTGSVYGADAGFVYGYFPGLQPLNGFYGLCALAFVVGRLYVRKRMVAFKSDAPKLYILLTAVVGGVYVIYSTMTGFILAQRVTVITAFVALIAFIVEIILNKVYFDKRKELFIY